MSRTWTPNACTEDNVLFQCNLPFSIDCRSRFSCRFSYAHQTLPKDALWDLTDRLQVSSLRLFMTLDYPELLTYVIALCSPMAPLLYHPSKSDTGPIVETPTHSSRSKTYTHGTKSGAFWDASHCKRISTKVTFSAISFLGTSGKYGSKVLKLLCL